MHTMLSLFFREKVIFIGSDNPLFLIHNLHLYDAYPLKTHQSKDIEYDSCIPWAGSVGGGQVNSTTRSHKRSTYPCISVRHLIAFEVASF